MNTAVRTRKRMTVDELLALPDDGKERWLIGGELWEREMTKRNRFRARLVVRVAYLLEEWCQKQPEPRGEVVGGEAGFILRRDPATTAGLDVAYVSSHTRSTQTNLTTMYDGPPVLAVEILSPNNTHEEVASKVRDYLACGVALVWVIDPDFGTVTVYQPGREPSLFNRTETISADPHLPGFSCPVAEFFR